MIFGNKKHITETQFQYLICLGAGINQLPIIQKGKELGYKIIAVDKDSFAPGFFEADIQIQCSLKHPGKIIKLIKENLPTDLIAGSVCRSFGAINLGASYVARSLLLPGLHPEIIKKFRNKKLIKKYAEEAGVKTAGTVYTGNLDYRSKATGINFPVIIKPLSGHAKENVMLIHSFAELEKKFPEGIQDQRWIVENFIEGDEVTVLGMVKDGNFHLGSISDKIKDPQTFTEIMHIYPSNIDESSKSLILTYMQRLADQFGIKNGPMVAEFIVKDQTPYLIECNPEIGGEFIADVMIPNGTGTDYFKNFILLSTSRKDEVNFQHEVKPVVIRFLMPDDGTLDGIHFPDELSNHSGFLFSRMLKNKNSNLKKIRRNLDRPCVFAITGDDREALIHEANSLAAKIEVVYHE